MIWATISSQSSFCWLYRASPFLASKLKSIWFCIDHLVLSMCRVFSCVVGRRCLLWPVCSIDKTVSLCPASFCTPKPNLPVLQGISSLPTFAFQFPIMKRTFFGGISSIKSVDPHRTIQPQLLQYYWSGHRLGLLWYWVVCLGNEQRSFCHFWDCILDCFVDCDDYCISS